MCLEITVLLAASYNCEAQSSILWEKVLGTKETRQIFVDNIGYYIMRNFISDRGHIVLLGQ